MRELRPGEPTAIGSYRLVGVLGAGGMGQVFLGIAPDGRLAAIKQVLAQIAEDEDFRLRFAREVEASRLVSGAYTAAVMEADPHAAKPWLASVFVAGPSLDAAVEAGGPLPGPALPLLTVGLTIALREIHRVGLVHRDLKPGNVLLTEDGPRLIDFGIAQAGDTNKITQAGSVIGSPGYMSPEQVEGKDVVPASDVFCLGSVLTYAATGRGPFGDATAPTLMYRVAYSEPELTGLPPFARSLVAACLAKDPARRPTVEQILAAVGQIRPGEQWLPPSVLRLIHTRHEGARRLAGAPPTAPHGPRTGPMPGPMPAGPMPHGHGHGHGPMPPSPGPRRRGRRAALIAGAAVLVVAATLTTVLAVRSAGTSPAEAAALVTTIAPDQDDPPDGFVVNDDPATPEVDGAAGDPLDIDRSGTVFACTASDPPTPAEAGLVARQNLSFVEDIPPEQGQAEGRFRDRLLYAVNYLDEDNRDQIMVEVRGRIVECEAGERGQGGEDYQFSFNDIPGAQENVGFIATVPGDAALDIDQQMISCEYVRVEALVLRLCALLTDDGGPESIENRLLARTRELLTPLIEAARREQDVS